MTYEVDAGSVNLRVEMLPFDGQYSEPAQVGCKLAITTDCWPYAAQVAAKAVLVSVYTKSDRSEDCKKLDGQASDVAYVGTYSQEESVDHDPSIADTVELAEPEPNALLESM